MEEGRKRKVGRRLLGRCSLVLQPSSLSPSYLKKILACPPLSALSAPPPPPPPSTLLSRDIFTRPFLRGRNLLQDMRPISPRAALSCLRSGRPTDRSCKGDVWCVRFGLRLVRSSLLQGTARVRKSCPSGTDRPTAAFFCFANVSGWAGFLCRIRDKRKEGEGGRI